MFIKANYRNSYTTPISECKPRNTGGSALQGGAFTATGASTSGFSGGGTLSGGAFLTRGAAVLSVFEFEPSHLFVNV